VKGREEREVASERQREMKEKKGGFVKEKGRGGGTRKTDDES
jgi:hypothetical protein